MKRLLMCWILLVSLPLASQEPPKKSDADRLLERYAELAQPGPEHERLRMLVGEWTIESRWQMDPRSKPEQVTGTASTRAILGGRFFESTARSNGPMGVESLTVLGFDRRTNEYTFISFDTLGTYSVTAAGKWNETEKAIVMRGNDNDPVLKIQQSYQVRIKPLTANQFVLSISFDLPGGKEMTAVESTYTRR